MSVFNTEQQAIMIRALISQLSIEVLSGLVFLVESKGRYIEEEQYSPIWPITEMGETTITRRVKPEYLDAFFEAVKMRLSENHIDTPVLRKVIKEAISSDIRIDIRALLIELYNNNIRPVNMPALNGMFSYSDETGFQPLPEYRRVITSCIEEMIESSVSTTL